MNPPEAEHRRVVDGDLAVRRPFAKVCGDEPELSLGPHSRQVRREIMVEEFSDPIGGAAYRRFARGVREHVPKRLIDIGVGQRREQEVQALRQQRHPGEGDVNRPLAVSHGDTAREPFEPRAPPAVGARTEAGRCRAPVAEEEPFVALAIAPARIGDVDQMAGLEDGTAVGAGSDAPGQRGARARGVFEPPVGRRHLGDATKRRHQLVAGTCRQNTPVRLCGIHRGDLP